MAGDDQPGGGFPAHFLKLVQRILHRLARPSAKLPHGVFKRFCFYFKGDGQAASRRHEGCLAQKADGAAGVVVAGHGDGSQTLDRADPAVGKDVLAIEVRPIHLDVV